MAEPRSSLVVLLALAACSGHAQPTDGRTDGASGRDGDGGAAQAGTAARGGATTTAAGTDAGGAGGSAGNGAGAAGTAGAAGAANASASASLTALQADAVSGTAVFIEQGDHVELKLTLTGCAAGSHALHLHANAACDDAGNAAGGHWSPQGESIPDVTCAADGSAELVFDAAPGAWTIGPPSSSDVLPHAVMLHAGPSADPGGRIACGILAKAP